MLSIFHTSLFTLIIFSHVHSHYKGILLETAMLFLSAMNNTQCSIYTFFRGADSSTVHVTTVRQCGSF
jgi:hypothetical protein